MGEHARRSAPRLAAEHPDRLALVDADPDPARRRSWTYAELLAAAERVARALLVRFRPGERVAVWAPNCAEWVLLQQGASLAGLVLVTVNPANRQAELDYVLRQSRAAGIFFAPEYRGFDLAQAVHAARAIAPELRETVSLADWDAFLALSDPARICPRSRPRDPVQIQYTSGTTGFPKGALLNHRGIVNASRFVAQGGGAADGAVWVNAMPMFHVGGSALAELGTFAFRGTFVLMPVFDAGLMLELFETYRGTITQAVPTMLSALLDHPDLSEAGHEQHAHDHVRCLFCARGAGSPGQGGVRLPVQHRLRPDRAARRDHPDPARRQPGRPVPDHRASAPAE